MSKLFSKYLKIYFLVLLLITPLLLIDKSNFVLFVNSLQTQFLDFFFKNITHFGDGLLVIPMLFLVLRYKLKWFAIFIIAFSLHVLFVHIFKQLFMNGSMRPYLYFQLQNKLELLNFVDGVKIRRYNTFPSGHTTTAFFLACFFSVKFKNRITSLVLLLLALLVGLSRIYLLQHFFIDVYFGMLFGILSFVLAHKIVKTYRRSWYRKRLVLSFRERKLPELIIQTQV